MLSSQLIQILKKLPAGSYVLIPRSDSNPGTITLLSQCMCGRLIWESQWCVILESDDGPKSNYSTTSLNLVISGIFARGLLRLKPLRDYLYLYSDSFSRYEKYLKRF